RFHRPPDPPGPGRRAPGQFHQWGALGPPYGPALGHGLSGRGGRHAAPPLATLRNGPGRPGLVRPGVVLRPQAPPDGPGRRRLPDGLRSVPVHGGVHPRTGRLPGAAGGRPVDGSVDVAAHDPDRAGAVHLGSKTIVPCTDTLTRSRPPSTGAAALSAAMALI